MKFNKYSNIDGLLLLDKPKGLSSNTILQHVKSIFSVKKAGHIGSLDPLATGMLPICFGRATKFSKYLLHSKKKYHVIAQLGENTSTGDISGICTNKKKVNIKLEKIIQILKKFHGIIQQIPSMYSAIKFQGIPLYKYARKGIIINRKKRILKIYKIVCLQYLYEFLELKIICSKGTYIRSLIEDIGKNLGCGAHVVYLRRLSVGPYNISNLTTLSQIYIKKYNTKFQKISNFSQNIKKYLLPLHSLVTEYPKIYLNEKEVFFFKNGKIIFLKKKKEIGLVQVLQKNTQDFIGMGKIKINNTLIVDRVLSHVLI
ncbi:tRNA pseudouridine(55) synthase TruB [Buchnera aphidicola]|uniref:tRNA pseudouridine synthase B n=1 Tax=Buchnera aphidicola subsp. Tuberolachnus salignus TaxID=98804 RepID=A0A170PBX4_BUCTT|nr:tRNA pseudouridine(55) synthase TruB [Buchnera aphidicola]CUR53223.1 tRNA pseudouridine synthase B [Buchnera aphidicola (Tuberolachnus salignus)]